MFYVLPLPTGERDREREIPALQHITNYGKLPSMFDIDVNEFLKSIVTEDFLLVAFVTYFVCEGLFKALPDFGDRYKQLIALVIGGILGFLAIPNDQYLLSVLHGIIAGGAATVLVARFKTPSISKIAEKVAKEKLVDHPTV